MNQAQLLRDLTLTYDEEGLRNLSESLQVNFNFLVGLTNQDKARALMSYLERRERLGELVEALVAERPSLSERYLVESPPPPKPDTADNLSWLEDLSYGGGQALEELPTLKWSESVFQETQIHMSEEEKDHLFAQEPTLKWPDADQSPVSPLQLPPYDTSKPVTDPQMFFGRERERQHIYNRLLNLDNTAVVGLRHIGKSSLLRFISQHEFWPSDQPYLFAYLNLEDAVYQDSMGLLNGALQQWENSVNQWVKNAPKRPYPLIGDLLTPTLKDEQDFAQRVQSLSMAGYRLVLCLDEFEQLIKRPSQFTPLFQSWHTLYEGGYLAFLTASQQPLDNLIQEARISTHFHTTFETLHLGLLTQEAAQDILNSPTDKRQIIVPSAAIKHLLTLCGRHPYYLQMAGVFLAHDLLLGHYRADKIVTEFVKQAEPSWRNLWQSLSPLAQAMLSLPLKSEAPAAILREYNRLERMGVLGMTENGRYQHFSQGFANWIKQEAKSQNLLQKLHQQHNQK